MSVSQSGHPSVVVDKGIIITVCAHEMRMICAKEALEKKVPAIENSYIVRQKPFCSYLSIWWSIVLVMVQAGSPEERERE